MLWFLTFGTACLLGLVTVLQRWSDAYIDRIKAKTILAADWQPLSAGEIHGDSLGNRFYILVRGYGITGGRLKRGEAREGVSPAESTTATT